MQPQKTSPLTLLTEPAQGEPAQGEPAQGEPAQGEPAQGEPAQGEPAQGEPAQGEPIPGGIYTLRIAVSAPIAVIFGRFQGGEPVALPAGDYVYVGSALGGLGRRLLRHATRTDGATHPVGPALMAHFHMDPPRSKRLRWHVDYLLDHPQASLTHIIALHTQQRLESPLARWLMAQPRTQIPAPGLGASDAKGEAHLLGMIDPPSLWPTIPDAMGGLAVAP